MDFNTADMSAIVNLIQYLDVSDERYNEHMTIKDFVAKAYEINDTKLIGKPEFQTIKALSNGDFGNYEIINFSTFDKDNNDRYFGAATIRGTDGTFYVSYRGTGDGKWLDNGEGMYKDETLMQKAARDYFDSLFDNDEKTLNYNKIRLTEDTKIIVTGHSKGGNEAQFVTMSSKYQTTQVLSILSHIFTSQTRLRTMLKNKTLFQRCVTLMALLTAISFLGGCFPMKVSLTTQMVEYINNKYPSDHFTYLRPESGSPGGNTKEIILKSRKFPDADVWVMLYQDKNGNIGFHDNYLHLKYEKQTHDKLYSFATNVFGNDLYFLYEPTDGGGGGTNFYDTMTFDEYFGDKESYIGFIAILPPSFVLNKEDLRNLITESIGKDNFMNFQASIRFSTNDDSAKYKRLKDGSLSFNSFVKQGDTSNLLQISVKDGKIEYLKWGELL